MLSRAHAVCTVPICVNTGQRRDAERLYRFYCCDYVSCIVPQSLVGEVLVIVRHLDDKYLVGREIAAEALVGAVYLHQDLQLPPPHDSLPTLKQSVRHVCRSVCQLHVPISIAPT